MLAQTPYKSKFGRIAPSLFEERGNVPIFLNETSLDSALNAFRLSHYALDSQNAEVENTLIAGICLVA